MDVDDVYVYLLEYTSESIKLLRPIVNKVLEIRLEGLQRDRLIELLNYVEGYLRYRLSVAGIKDSVLLKRLSKFREVIEYLPPLPISISIHPAKHVESLTELLESLPQLSRPGLFLPKPSDVAQVLK